LASARVRDAVRGSSARQAFEYAPKSVPRAEVGQGRVVGSREREVVGNVVCGRRAAGRARKLREDVAGEGVVGDDGADTQAATARGAGRDVEVECSREQGTFALAAKRSPPRRRS
jgi:hypothetical protein